MTRDLRGGPVLVVGAGIIGAGIAQVAAQAGHAVLLYDARDGAAANARDKLRTTLDALVAKGKLSAADADSTLARIEVVVRTLQAAAAAASLVVKAIVEDLAAKRSVFAQLEAVLADDAVLATNTSSISVTAIAYGLRHPERLVGVHFFQPGAADGAGRGGQRPADVAGGCTGGIRPRAGLAKTAVHASSTPGFIVNRIARP